MRGAIRDVIVDLGPKVLHQKLELHQRDAAHGFRYDDAAFGIAWPIEKKTLSETHLSSATFQDAPAQRPPCP